MVYLKIIIFLLVVIFLSPYVLCLFSFYLSHKRKKECRNIVYTSQKPSGPVCEAAGGYRHNARAKCLSASQGLSGGKSGVSEKQTEGQKGRVNEDCSVESESPLVYRPVAEARAKLGDLEFTPDDDDVIKDDEYLRHLEQEAAINRQYEEDIEESVLGEEQEKE